MVDETGFPRGKGRGNCPTFCSFSLPGTSPPRLVPAQKGLAGPGEPWGHAPLCHPAGMLKVGQAGRWPALAAWQRSAKLGGPGRNSQAAPLSSSRSMNHLEKGGGDVFEMQILPPVVKPGNVRFY